jgi:hypothetical protein
MRRTTTDRWKQVGSILIPSRVPEKVGLGCPKHDDHELVLYTRMQQDEEKKRFEAFVKKHTACGPLETLELHEGRLEITGELRETAS